MSDTQLPPSPAGPGGNDDVQARRAALRRENLQVPPPSAPSPARPVTPPSGGRPAASAPKAKAGGGPDLGELFTTLFDGVDERLPDNVPAFINGKTVVFSLGGIIILLLIVGLVFALSGGEPSTAVTVTPAPLASAAPTMVPTPMPTPSAFDNLETMKVPEYSPAFTPTMDIPALTGRFFQLVVLAFMFADVLMRKQVGMGAKLLNAAGACAGLFTVHLINWSVSQTLIPVTAGFAISLITVALLWGAAVLSKFTHNDFTALGGAFSLFAAELFYTGQFAWPVGWAALFGSTATAWTSITSLSGWVSLMMGHRGGEATLTGVMVLMSLLGFVVNSAELAKKQKWYSGAALATVILVGWYLCGLLIGVAVNWVTVNRAPSADLVLLMEVMRPILAWVLALIGTLVLGSYASDALNRIGVDPSSLTWVDFSLLATVVALMASIIRVF